MADNALPSPDVVEPLRTRDRLIVAAIIVAILGVAGWAVYGTVEGQRTNDDFNRQQVETMLGG